jgi:hypothetical protein
MRFSIWHSLAGVLALAFVHVFSGWLGRTTEERPSWLSAASGVSLAYVFVHLLPELSEAQAGGFQAAAERSPLALDRQVYLAALAGMLLALGLERFALARGSTHGAFWPHMLGLCAYNLLIGGFALRLRSLVALVLAWVAFSAHVLINDHGLRREYGRAYQHVGRWALAGALLCGWAIAAMARPPAQLVSVLLGLVAGGVMLNSIKEELPSTRQARLPALLASAVVYSGLLLALARRQSEG